MQSAMNMAVNEASRQIWIGNAQGSISSPSFVKTYVCPAVGFMVDCSLITMRAQPVSSDRHVRFLLLYEVE